MLPAWEGRLSTETGPAAIRAARRAENGFVEEEDVAFSFCVRA